MVTITIGGESSRVTSAFIRILAEALTDFNIEADVEEEDDRPYAAHVARLEEFVDEGGTVRIVGG